MFHPMICRNLSGWLLVSSQLLERRYKGQLDNEADDYIDFIVEGAHRMKYLIDDLFNILTSYQSN